VHEAVRADDLHARARRGAVDSGDPPACLLDERQQRRIVPALEPRVDGGIEGALGDERALPEVADAARVPDERLDPREVLRVGAGDRGIGQPLDARDPDPLAVPEGAFAAGRPPAAAQCRRRRDAADDPPLPLERDQGRPDRDPAGEVLRTVDRVEDPADRSAAAALLLAEDALAGALDCDPLSQGSLDCAVGVGYRCQVGLRLDAEVRGAEAGQAEGVGEAGQLERELEVGAQPAIPRTRDSSSRPAASTRASAPVGPTSCTDAGSPSSAEPQGRARAGQPRTSKG